MKQAREWRKIVNYNEMNQNNKQARNRKRQIKLSSKKRMEAAEKAKPNYNSKNRIS